MRRDLSNFSVSRETTEKLEIFEQELRNWTSSINLISSDSRKNVWDRHIIDSLQLLKAIPETVLSVLDIGSGAGFPGIILAITKPQLKIHLVESDRRKCAFLQHIVSLLDLNCGIHPSRCEDLVSSQMDLVTSRACASLSRLLDISVNHRTPKTICVFPKGRRYSSEIEEASLKWRFELQTFQSITDPEGVILSLHEIEPV